MPSTRRFGPPPSRGAAAAPRQGRRWRAQPWTTARLSAARAVAAAPRQIGHARWLRWAAARLARALGLMGSRAVVAQQDADSVIEAVPRLRPAQATPELDGKPMRSCLRTTA